MPNQVLIKSKKPKLPPKYWLEKNRVNAFQKPPPPLYRRVLRFFFNPLSISLYALFILGAFLTFTYFWFEYSERIDRRLLSGQVYTQSAGIYSAPKTLKSGESITLADLTDYLKTAGYIEKNSQADISRSRYQTGENAIEIEPGITGTIDDVKVFPALSVKFDKSGKTVKTIIDKATEKAVDKAQIEPKILSSIAEEGDGRRKAVTFNDLPPHLIKSITVTEDRAFFEHYGVNFRGIARALWRRYEHEENNSPIANQGGSSITQQLVKNLWLNREQTLTRKIKEAFMSVILETRLTKEEIFTLYVNQIYLGQQAGVSIYGVGEAANVYFGKDVSQLSLPETAFLAGIIRSPNRYNPYKNLEKVTERRNQVLDSMTETGNISFQESEQAKKTKLELHQISNRRDLQGMPYFSQYAIEELPKVINDAEAVKHLRVYTTIDPDLQRIAYEIVNKRLEKLDKYFPKKEKGILNAALVAIRPKTGEIVAMVGGRNFLENQFNRATDAMRQPGSVFKPFVYATAINSAYEGNSSVFTAASIFKDEKKVFTFGSDTYAPNNYGDVFSNKEITLRDALVKSKNVITVDLGMQLNIGKVMNLANKAGLPKVEKAYPSMALGTAEATPLQIATGYTIFANLGEKVTPMPISRVTTGGGKTVVAPNVEKKTVLRSDVAYIMDDIMKDVINRGTAAEAQAWGFKNVEGKQGFAGKTGTSRDGWFAGFTPEIVCVVYVGFDDGDDLGMKGSDSAMPIWADFMREALNRNPEWNGDWAMPVTVHKAEIDSRNGKLIRELDNAQADLLKAQQTVIKKSANANTNTNTNTDSVISPEDLESKAIYVTEVPPEFRRVELFVSGTVPNKVLLPTVEETVVENVEAKPSPSSTPFTTWQESQEINKDNPANSANTNIYSKTEEIDRKITIMICPLTGMRSTSNCPQKEPQTFREGKEPKDFCTFHVNPPR
ncbi:MAG: PBP1A family penicillin-binding protein [Pyrinomonadaceae bacterium]|nr:PBP1A family penicillin-binding protein [Pyrinomonadaceae bacterium]